MVPAQPRRSPAFVFEHCQARPLSPAIDRFVGASPTRYQMWLLAYLSELTSLCTALGCAWTMITMTGITGWLPLALSRSPLQKTCEPSFNRERELLYDTLEWRANHSPYRQ